MQHMCVVEVIDKKVFPDFQQKFLADPKSGACPFYNVGDRFVFRRYGDDDTFWTIGKGSQCAEAWDCISRYIYTALQGGSIMRHWTNDERIMIACCNDGTRPVIFKIERLDYFAIYIDENPNEIDVKNSLKNVEGVLSVNSYKDFFEVVIDSHNPIINEGKIREAIEKSRFKIDRID